MDEIRYYCTMNYPESLNSFFVAAYEAGVENTPVPTWAANANNPLDLHETDNKVLQRIKIETVPGAFQLINVLTKEECSRFISVTETLGYTQDASVSLSRSVRHNENLVWIVDDKTHDIIWNRCKAFMEDPKNIFNGKKPLCRQRQSRKTCHARRRRKDRRCQDTRRRDPLLSARDTPYALPA